MDSPNAVYLDWAGSARPTKEQLRRIFEHHQQLQLANTHSHNAHSRICAELVEQARHR